MANIGIDAKRAFKNFSGLGNYSRALISGLSRFYPYNRYFLYTPPWEGDGKWRQFSKGENITIVEPKGIYHALPHAIWRSSGIVKDIKRNQIDLFHGLSAELPVQNFSAPKVVTMHDIIFMRYPQFYNSFDRYMYEKKARQACKEADKIIAISKQTADDIIHYLNADARKIEIVYQGCDKIFYTDPTEEKLKEIKEKYDLPERYILNVGTIEERKNLVNVVKAMSMIPDDIHLIALGRSTPYTQQVQSAAREFGVENRVRLIHNANFLDFPYLYKQAIAVTYVSVFEGFGIPVLEALTIGTPVITSNLSSMPEAGGDAALYVDPLNYNEIAGKINLLLSSPTITENVIARGKLHARSFREEAVIKNIHDIYKSLLKQ